MPWGAVTVEDARYSLVSAMLREEVSVAALARSFGVSRRVAYKWLDRFKAGGQAGLADQSRARLSQPLAVSEEVRALLIRTRRAHPTWGVKKLLPWLEKRHPLTDLPCRSTAGEILREAGLTEPKGVARRKPTAACPGAEEPTAPNQVWTVDFKGQFRMGDGALCYPLTVADRVSRYLLLTRGQPSTAGGPVKRAFEELFVEYGLPDRVRSDNGTPFAGTGLGRLSVLSVWWMSLDVLPDLIRPGHPGENGRHERMHRVLKAETARPPGRDMEEQQAKFDRFVPEYNQERPHEALNFACPAGVYRPSQREYRPSVKADDDVYPGHWERRVVKPTGCIKWKNRMVYVSEPLAGRVIGLHETQEGLWELHYRRYAAGLLNERDGEARVEDLRKPAAPGACTAASGGPHG